MNIVGYNIVQRLRFHLKNAIRSGKIAVDYDRSEIYTSVKAGNNCNGDDLLDTEFWDKFVTDPNSSWSDFIKAEASLRASLSVKPLTVKTKYTHPEPSHWIKTVSLLYRVFYKDNAFNNIRPDGRPFSLEFLKFSKRILLFQCFCLSVMY